MTHPTTDRLYEALGQGITTDDDGTLLDWLDGPTSLLGEVDDVVRDTDDGLGWAREFDTELSHSLRWVGQFLGVVVPDAATDAQARSLIAERPAFRRGTVSALTAATQDHLTGSRYVGLRERDGSPYRLTVTTYTDETPDPAATEATLRAGKPAGLVLTYQVVASTSYTALESQTALTYTALEAQTALTYTDQEAGL